MKTVSKLRIHGQGGVYVGDIASFLEALRLAYNAIYNFELIFDRHDRRLIADFIPVWRPYLLYQYREAFNHNVLSKHRLVLAAVELGSPGFWDFLGKLNPLEVIRQYLSDRHARKQDNAFRNAAEKERLALENQLLRNKVLRERIEIVQAAGAHKAEYEPILNELIYGPLHELDKFQDSRIIDSAEIIQLELPEGNDPSKD